MMKKMTVLLVLTLCGCVVEQKIKPSKTIDIDSPITDAGFTADTVDEQALNDTDIVEYDCGNDILEPGELCDGDCSTCEPTGCDIFEIAGSASTCDVVCVPMEEIVTCLNDDGCCPAGCDFTNDDDCACVPMTCEDVGAVCGTVDDGCGESILCGVCETGECFQGNCGPAVVGSTCTASTDCGGGEAGECLLDEPGGYCTRLCAEGVLPCEAGAVCELSPLSPFCRVSCSDSEDCRVGYRCASLSTVDDRRGCVPE